MNASAEILSAMNRVTMGANTMNIKIDKVESSARDVSANITTLNTIIQETRESVGKLCIAVQNVRETALMPGSMYGAISRLLRLAHSMDV